MTKKLEEILNLPNVKEAFKQVDAKEKVKETKNSNGVSSKNLDPQTAKNLEKSYLSKNFVGYIEGNDIINGQVDVVISDGFSGNIALKTAEGVATVCSNYIKNSLTQIYCIASYQSG